MLRYIIFIHPFHVPCLELIKHVSDTNAHIINLKAKNVDKPKYVKGVPTLVDLETRKIYEGSQCFHLLGAPLPNDMKSSTTTNTDTNTNTTDVISISTDDCTVAQQQHCRSPISFLLM